MKSKKLERLLDAFFLLAQDKTSKYHAMIKELILIVENEAKKSTMDISPLERFFVSALKSLVSGTMDITDPTSISKLLLKCKMELNKTSDAEVAEDVLKVYTQRSQQELEFPEEKEIYIERIETFIQRSQMEGLMRQIYGILSSCEGLDEEDEIAGVREAQRRLKEGVHHLVEKTYTEAGGVKPVGVIKFSDKESVQKALEKRSKRDLEGIIKSGLQGLNRALGSNGGLVPGESICHCALSHHGKSLSIISWAIWAVENTPKVDRGGKIPLVLLTSLENEEYRNMLDIFKRKYRQIEGKSGESLNNDEIRDWITNYFDKFETKLIIERFTDDYGIDEHRARISYYQSQGYEIVMSCIDYLSNMAISDTKRYLGLRELSHQLVNDARRYGYCLVTGHQLNREASRIEEYNLHPAKMYNMNHLQDTTSIFLEFDIIVFQHKVLVESTKRSYMTYKLAKHRHVEDTPDAHKYFAYEFLPDGIGIQDDLHTAPRFVKDPRNDDSFLSDIIGISKSSSPEEDALSF